MTFPVPVRMVMTTNRPRAIIEIIRTIGPMRIVPIKRYQLVRAAGTTLTIQAAPFGAGRESHTFLSGSIQFRPVGRGA